MAYVALGSNLGDRQAHLAFARARLGDLPGTRLVAASSIEETMPIGGLDQPPYLNQMVAIETALTPHELLAHLHRIEAERGRVRGERWAPRPLDLDLVEYGSQQIRDATLEVPHPGLASRDFWQRELEELKARRELQASPERTSPTEPSP